MFWDRNFKDHNRMMVVNFAFLNHISEDFLHDVLTFTLKNAYTVKRKRHIKDRFRYLNHEVIVLIDNYTNQVLLFFTLCRNWDKCDAVVYTATAFILRKCCISISIQLIKKIKTNI